MYKALKNIPAHGFLLMRHAVNFGQHPKPTDITTVLHSLLNDNVSPIHKRTMTAFINH